MAMANDTRKLLKTGSWILGFGVLSIVMLYVAFGGAGHHGPHNNGGWLMLIFALGCLPMGVLILALGLSKLIGERSR